MHNIINNTIININVVSCTYNPPFIRESETAAAARIYPEHTLYTHRYYIIKLYIIQQFFAFPKVISGASSPAYHMHNIKPI